MVKCLPPLAALCAVAALAGTARASSMDTNAYMKTGVGLSLSKSNPAYGGAWDESVTIVEPEDVDAESARSITVNETLKAEYADADARRLSGSVSDQRNRLRQRMMEATSSDIEDLEEYFGVSMERSLSVLNSTYLSGEAPSVPWPSSYWPTFQDGINYEWAGEASPAEKYATAFGLDVTDFMDKVSKATGIDSQSSATKCTSDRSCGTSACAIRSGESSGYCIPTWYGICHAWAPASILEAEPECPVTKNGVTFQVMDIKALLTQVYDDAGVSTVFTGARFNGPDSPASTDQYGRYTSAARRDLGPGFFHIAVTNIMGKHKQSFVLDVSSNSEVWNQPVRSYSVDQIDLVDTATVCAKYFGVEEYPFNSAAKHLAHVKMTMKWVVEAGQDGPLVSTGYVDSYTTSDQYEYLLELDDDYSIIGGEWLGNSQDDHPDFLWFATGKADKSTVTEVGLSYADVEELLNESVACGSTTETPTPTPTPTETPEATTEAPTATPEATTEAPTEAPTATPETTTATPVESSASGSDAGSNDIEIPTETPEVTTATPVETSESGSESGSDAGSESGSDATEAPTATPETTTATPVESSESGSDAGSDSTEAPTATPGATTAPTATPGATTAPTSTPVPTYTGGKGGKGGVVYTTPAPTTAPTTGATTAPTTAPPADGSDVDSDNSEANSGDDSDDSDDDERSSSSDNDSTEAPAVTPASGKGGKGGVVYTTPAPTTETPATTPVTTETPVTTPPTTTSGDENEKTPEPTTAAVTETPAATTTVPSTGSGNDETPAPTTTVPSTGSGNDETPAPTTTEVTTEAPATTPASGKGGKGGVVYTTPAPTTAEVTEVPSTGNSQESTPAPTTTAPSTESGDDESDDGDDEVTPAPTTTEVTEAPTPAPTATGGETEEVTPAPTTVTETVAPTPAPTATGGETEEATPAPTTVTVTDAPNTSTGDDVTEAPSTESPKDDMEYSTPAPTATTDVTDAPSTSTGDDETEAPTPAPTTSTDDDDDEDDDDDDDYTPGTTSPKDSMDYSTPAPTPAATTATSTGDSSNEQVTPAPTTVSGKDPHKICV